MNIIRRLALRLLLAITLFAMWTTTGAFAALGKESSKSVGFNAANTATRWGPATGAGPLGERVVATFRGGLYTEMVASEATTLYRVYGGKSGQLGSYWTRTGPGGPMQSQFDSALLTEWGGTASNVVKIQVPKGTTIFDGLQHPKRKH